MRRPRAGAVTLGVIAICAWAFGAQDRAAAAPPVQAAIEVRIVEFAFQPQTVTINVGQSVTWTNNGSTLHTTTSTLPSNDPNYWDVRIPPGFAFERQFTTPGTFTYFCSIHRDQGMTGTIVVQALATATPTTPPATPTATTPPPPTPTRPAPTPGTPIPPTPGTPGLQPSLFINSPTEGQTIVGTDVEVQLEIANLTLRPPGTPNRAGEGSISLFLDNLPEQRISDRTFTFRNVSPGTHVLRVELRQNDGTPFTPPVQVTVNFRTQLPGGGLTPTPGTPPAQVTGVAATPTVGLPRTGDGTYGGRGPDVASWLIAVVPLGVFLAALYRRARHRPS
ncbi:MAG: cupredoxin domain-containing protein [Dehalococcoidia bacterium]|nr:cupredoxin domain-containing protein [Dehalococcoidia bacterium]